MYVCVSYASRDATYHVVHQLTHTPPKKNKLIQPRARKPVWPGRDYWNPLAKDMVGVEKAHLPAADLPFHDRCVRKRALQCCSDVVGRV